MATELTPSEYEKLTAAGKVKSPQPRPYLKWAIAAAVVIVLCGLSFVAGESAQKNHRTTTTATGQTRAFGPGGFRNRQRPVIGQVTAVSDSSITLTTAQNTSQTFKITSSTTIDNNGATAAASDIKTGDTVLVQTVAGDTTTARRILLNPAVTTPQDNSTTPAATSAPTLSN